MKKSVKFLAAGLLALSLASCRNNDAPEDIHEHEEANKVVMTVTETGTTNTQTVTFNVGSATDKALSLSAGKSYDATVKFIHTANGKDEDLTPEIIKEKDEHFIVYQFGNATAKVTRAADVVRTDGKKVGINTKWEVTAAPSASKVVMKLVHQPTTLDDAANNGGGSYTGGSDDVVMNVNIN